MCNFLSGIVTIENYPRILCTNLLHHEITVNGSGLKPEQYREWEWTSDDEGRSLSVRAAPGENPNVLKSAILAKYPNRKACLKFCIDQILKLKNINLDGLTSVPDNFKLPDRVGGYLDLRGLTSVPDNFKLPDSVGGCLDLRGLTSVPDNFKLPDSVGGVYMLDSIIKKIKRNKH